ncbi:MAG: DUF411 domain-containing protein [Candidatus Binatia bacterium]|nr:DUF411 domain-containing protein [Candidatus Binatia bacterium]
MVKRKHGVPKSFYSCHTALVQGYVIEGHVPVDLIMGLLEDRPPLAGLGVGGDAHGFSRDGRSQPTAL